MTEPQTPTTGTDAAKDASAYVDPRVAAFPLFAQASRHEMLWTAWERVRANRGAAGGDGVSVAHFETIASTRLARLSHELREGRYRPGPSRRVLIPKADGGQRPLDIPCVIDRIAQSAVALTLQPVLEPEFEDSSFAYRPGRSVAQAVQRVASLRRAGYTHVVDGDIVRYFERVPHERLIERLERHVDDRRLVDLIALWLECHSPQGLGLPQGSPLSPLLANLYLDEVDEAIEGRGVRLVRFADDFVLLCKSETAAEGALGKMRELLAAHGLELHPEKTRIVPFDQGFRFLGHVFVRSMVWREVFADDLPEEDVIAGAEAILKQAAAPLVENRPGGSSESEDEDEKATAESRGRWANRQRLVYVLEPGRRLVTAGTHFVVTEGTGEAEARLLEIPHRRVDRIEIGPEVAIDVTALDLASATDTEIVRINGRGETMGRWDGPWTRARARRHLAQAATVLDPQRRRALAQALVRGRVHSQSMLLKRLNRTRRDAELSAAAVQLARILRRLDRQELAIDAAMGQEGAAAAIFWPALARALPPQWSWSGRRKRRSGEDAVNLVLDALASLLARDIRIAAIRQGLHPGFAALHETEDGEDALVYDLIEEFRAPVAEACTLALFGRKALDKESFVGEVEARWRVSRQGYAAIIRGYEAWVARPIQSPRSGEKTTWRGLFEEQAIAYAEHCEGGAAYRPYRMDY